MEGKSGILVILVVLDVLLLVCAIAFGVFFGVEMSMVFENNILNLYVSLGSGAMFILTSLGIIIARNARITADNSYDILRHVELLLKKEGISLADLARRDKKVAEKIEAETRKKAEKAKKKGKVEEESDDLVEAEPVAEEVESAPVAEEASEELEPVGSTEPVAEPVVHEEDADVNLGFDLNAWREALEGKVACGLCGKPVLVKPTKKVAFILMCSDVPKRACNNKLMTVGEFGAKFIEWFSAFYGERPARFSLDDFNAKVKSVTITNGECHFVSKDV